MVGDSTARLVPSLGQGPLFPADGAPPNHPLDEGHRQR